jgi:hypothetical protein
MTSAKPPTIVIQANGKSENVDRAVLVLLSQLADGLARSGFAAAAQNYPELAAMFRRNSAGDSGLDSVIQQTAENCTRLLMPVVSALRDISAAAAARAEVVSARELTGASEEARVAVSAAAPEASVTKAPRANSRAARSARSQRVAEAQSLEARKSQTPEPTPDLVDIGKLSRKRRSRAAGNRTR